MSFKDYHELQNLKRKVRKLFAEATEDHGADCGNSLLDEIIVGRVAARQEFEKLWKRIRELDPKAPVSPFSYGA